MFGVLIFVVYKLGNCLLEWVRIFLVSYILVFIERFLRILLIMILFILVELVFWLFFVLIDVGLLNIELVFI